MKEKKLMNRKFAKEIITCLISLLSVCLVVLFFARVLTNISVGAESYSTDIEVNLEKYVNFKISDQDKGTLTQYNVKSTINQEEGKEYLPIKESELTISLNQINGKYPYAVKVITASTELTNGKTEDIQEDYQYTESTGTVVIKTSNENENGEPINSAAPSLDAKDEHIIICYYDTYVEQSEEREIGLKVGLKSVLFEDDIVIDYQDEFKETVKDNISELTSVSHTTDEVYNGYIKSNVINGTNYNTQYKEKQSIIVSKKEAQEKLEVLEENTFVKIEKNQNDEEITTDLGNNGKLIYKSTKIKKSDIINLLGEDGIVEILDKDENVLATIDKNTKFEEDGTIVINYEDELEAIIVKTSAVKNEGILNLENTKEIKSTMLSVINTKIKTTGKIVGTKEKVEIVNNEEVKTDVETFTNDYENMIDIKETSTNVEMEINSLKWTNKQQNEVVFDIYVDSNTAKNNMLKNPNIKIELPSQVEKVILGNSSVVYANGLQLQTPSLEKSQNGNIVIVANLIGTQTEYDENTLGLITDVKIAATVILKKDIENSLENVNLTYSNNYTLDGSTETITKSKELQIESYKDESVTVEESSATTDSFSTFTTSVNSTQVEGLKMEVEPVRGDTVLKDGDTVYEGEFIKYNIKVTNTSDKRIDDIKVVGNIPEGTTYGELEADYYTIWGKYDYKYNNELREKILEVGTLDAGKSISKFYEVKVNDLEEGQAEKQLSSTIKTYINNVETANYVINNKAQQADVKVFMSSDLNGIGENGWNYAAHITSSEDKTVEIKMQLPTICNIGNIYNATQQENISNIKTTEDNIITATVNLKANVENIILAQVQMDSTKIKNKTDESQIEVLSVAKVMLNDKTCTSNENRTIYGYDNISIVMTSENEGEDVKEQEEINYKIVVKNIGKCNLSGKATNIRLTDFLSEDLQPISMKYENWVGEKNVIDEENGLYSYTGKYTKELQEKDISYYYVDENGEKLPNVDLYLTIPYGESVTIDIKTKADYVVEKTKIENCSTISGNSIEAKNSNIVIHNIIKDDYDEIIEDPTDKPEDKPSDDENNTEGEVDTDKNQKYSISGVAWLDENSDGKRQTTEKLLQEIPVWLVNMKESSEIQQRQTTDANGKYNFTNLEKGNYIVVFRYDSENYSTTQYKETGVANETNSDATTQEIKISGNKAIVGLTDILSVDASLTNIDIGLIKNKICDLKIDKYISKVTVETSSGTKEKTYDNTKLAKVEIKSKEIKDAKVTVEYKIVVTNEGEIEASADQIIDYLPEGLEFSAETNKNWIKNKNGEISNISLINKKIKPGESVELTLIATKTMTEDSTGIFTNVVEIAQMSNDFERKDIDSTPGNRVETEDDYSKAELIISIGTGGVILYIGIIIVSLVLVVLTFKFIRFKIVKFIVVFAFGSILLFGHYNDAIANGWKVKSAPEILWIKNKGTGSSLSHWFSGYYQLNKDSQKEEIPDYVGIGCMDQWFGASTNAYQKYEKYDEDVYETTYSTSSSGDVNFKFNKNTNTNVAITGEKKEGNYYVYTVKNIDIQIRDIDEYNGKFILKNSNSQAADKTEYDSKEKCFKFYMKETCTVKEITKVTVEASKKTMNVKKIEEKIKCFYKPKNKFIDDIKGKEYSWSNGNDDNKVNEQDGWFSYNGQFFQGVQLEICKTFNEETTKTANKELTWDVGKKSIKIIKEAKDSEKNITDGEGNTIHQNRLPGATFNVTIDSKNIHGKKIREGYYVYDNSIKDELTEFVTDYNGEINIINIPMDKETCQITEIKPPDNYYYDGDNTKEINWSGESFVQTVTFDNYSYGRLQILKVDEEGNNRLEGAIFAIAKIENDKPAGYLAGELIDGVYTAELELKTDIYKKEDIPDKCKFTTDYEGIIDIIKVKQGKYRIIELEAPEGYEINQKESDVEVKGIYRNSREENFIEYLKYMAKNKINNINDEDNIDEIWKLVIGNDKLYTDTETYYKIYTEIQNEYENLSKDEFIEYIYYNYSKEYNYYYSNLNSELKGNDDLKIHNEVFQHINENFGGNEDVYKYEAFLWTYRVQGGTSVVFFNKEKKSTINLSGYVWKENELKEPDGQYNNKEQKITGIEVRLVNSKGEIAKDQNGNEYKQTINKTEGYKFENVEKDKLKDYHLEVSYNGMSYQATSDEYKLNSNGNVFVEGDKREAFNNKFAIIQPNMAISNDYRTTTLSYLRQSNQSKLYLYKDTTIESKPVTNVYDKYMIKNVGTLNIMDQEGNLQIGEYNSNKDTISGLNLGLYIREMPDIQLEMNIASVKVSVNGKESTYANITDLPIYRADYKADNFQIDIEYKITCKDMKKYKYTNLKTEVNSIYFYTVIGNGQITNQKYSYITDISDNGTKTINVTLKKEELANYELDKLQISSYAEIASYSTKDNGKYYGGIDTDSNPGNLDTNNFAGTDEDDSDMVSPTIKPSIRQISGVIFEDEAISQGKGNERIGNGIYDQNESMVSGVKVGLYKKTDIDSDGKIRPNATYLRTGTSDENGKYTILDFAAGDDYVLVYTWGENPTYNVKDYKSTIWIKDNKDKKDTYGNEWYKYGNERYSDALDNWDIRKNIDNDESITTMTAVTNTMNIGIEIEGDGINEETNDDRIVTINNIDFGLIERPIQKLDISKRVSSVKITLANGQTIVDAKVKDNELVGDSTQYVTYKAPDPTKTPWNGLLRVEIDNELIQGSTLQIGYEIEVNNNSELDYVSEEYYKYGTDKSNTNIVKIQPKGVYDYLDQIITPNLTENWHETELSKYQSDYNDGTIIDKYFINSTTETKGDGTVEQKNEWEVENATYKNIFEEWWSNSKKTIGELTKYKAQDKRLLSAKLEKSELEPGDNEKVELSSSKVLANTDEITINNDTEIVEVTQDYGRKITPKTSKLYDRGETVIITPPTGENKAYIIPIAVGIISLVILLGGIILIKKKVL